MSGLLIGVDIGGTKLSVACLDHGRLREQSVLPTEQEDAGALIDEIVAAVEGIGGPDVLAVGVGIPSIVEFATGRARSSVNVPLRDVPLRDVLRDRLGLPVYVDNDATCAALAEAYDGDRRVVENLVMFTVGTGIGGGLVLGGRVYRGATGAAGELGHKLIGATLHDGAPEASSFPHPASLESLASGRALDALAADAAKAHPESALGRLAASGRGVRGPDAVDLARAGDAAASSVVRVVAERLGVAVANAIHIFDPDVVAIGGGVSRAGDLLLEPIREAAWRFVLPGVGDRTEIRLARHGSEAGVRGAALLARQELDAEGSLEPTAEPKRPAT